MENYEYKHEDWFCPKCDVQMNFANITGVALECPSCKQQYPVPWDYYQLMLKNW